MQYHAQLVHMLNGKIALVNLVTHTAQHAQISICITVRLANRMMNLTSDTPHIQEISASGALLRICTEIWQLTFVTLVTVLVRDASGLGCLNVELAKQGTL